MRFPLRPPTGGLASEADSLFQQLKEFCKPTEASQPRGPRASWILDATWKLVDQRAGLAWLAGGYSQTINRRLSWQIRISLKGDRTRRTKAVGAEVESLLSAGRLKEGCARLRAWYNHAGDRAPDILDDVPTIRRLRMLSAG